ncbi:MAG: hypothetical protein IPM94_13060 [bacterium]|nr:hypothetical protein [bacterium]
MELYHALSTISKSRCAWRNLSQERQDEIHLRARLWRLPARSTGQTLVLMSSMSSAFLRGVNELQSAALANMSSSALVVRLRIRTDRAGPMTIQKTAPQSVFAVDQGLPMLPK